MAGELITEPRQHPFADSREADRIDRHVLDEVVDQGLIGDVLRVRWTRLYAEGESTRHERWAAATSGQPSDDRDMALGT